MAHDEPAREAAWRRSFAHVSHVCVAESTGRFCVDCGRVFGQAEQFELLGVVPETNQRSRLLKTVDHANPERIYLAEWKRFCRRVGPHALNMIVWRTWDKASGQERYPSFATRRDAVVVTSFVQWLATNVGDGFIRSCMDKVAAERKAVDAANQARFRLTRALAKETDAST